MKTVTRTVFALILFAACPGLDSARAQANAQSSETEQVLNAHLSAFGSGDVDAADRPSSCR